MQTKFSRATQWSFRTFAPRYLANPSSINLKLVDGACGCSLAAAVNIILYIYKIFEMQLKLFRWTSAFQLTSSIRSTESDMI